MAMLATEYIVELAETGPDGNKTRRKTITKFNSNDFEVFLYSDPTFTLTRDGGQAKEAGLGGVSNSS